MWIGGQRPSRTGRAVRLAPRDLGMSGDLDRKGAETSDDQPVDADNESDSDADSDSDSFLQALAKAPALTPGDGSRGRGPSSESLTKLGRFSIVEMIGRGGMGIVYRAQDEKLRRVVALKVLPEDFADDA